MIVFVAAAAADDDDYDDDDDDENDTTPMTTAEGVMASVNVCCFVFLLPSVPRFFSSAGHSQSRDLCHDICCDEEFAENVPLFALFTALSANKRKRLVSFFLFRARLY